LTEEVAASSFWSMAEIWNFFPRCQINSVVDGHVACFAAELDAHQISIR
jgi:hypothetical protein